MIKPIHSIIRQIPSVITSLNLVTGCFSIVCAMNNQLVIASILIFLAGLFDFSDGFSARMLKAYSEFGKSLDSLADVVSFGIAPSIIMVELLTKAVQSSDHGFQFLQGGFWESFEVTCGFFIAVFSAIRLAKFNIDQRQVNTFIGVPTPINAFFIASLPIVLSRYQVMEHWILHTYILLPLICILSFLLVCNVPMISLKFKNYAFTGNQSKYILLGGSGLLFLFFQFSAFPLIYILYVLVSLTMKTIN